MQYNITPAASKVTTGVMALQHSVPCLLTHASQPAVLLRATARRRPALRQPAPAQQCTALASCAAPGSPQASWASYNSSGSVCRTHAQRRQGLPPRLRPNAAAGGSGETSPSAASGQPPDPTASSSAASSGEAPSADAERLASHAAASTSGAGDGENASVDFYGHTSDLAAMDANELQTALHKAIAAEDYQLAGRVRDRLRAALGGEGGGEGGDSLLSDWRALGVPEWLAGRVERMGYKFPTEVQKRAGAVAARGEDLLVRSQTGSGKTLAYAVPLLSRLSYPPITWPDDLRGPAGVVVVPTRELGVQVVMLIYKLLGGSVNAGVPGDPGNMFTYSGPRGIKVRGVLNKEEVLLAKNAAYLKGCHVVVGTPEALAELASPPEALDALAHAAVVVVDEVDACFKEQPAAMEALMAAACRLTPERGLRPQVVFVGATVEDGVAEHAVQQGWMLDPVTVSVGAAGVPAGLQHRYIVVDEGRRLAALTRQIRQDLAAQGEDLPPARVMVFAASEEEARRAAVPVRNVLWGQHKVSVLLPGGEQPIQALHAFRDNKASLLLATPAAARGLDLPAVSYVYNLHPPESATAYLHRAGRAGRIGSPVKGVVTTLATPEQLPALHSLAAQLGLSLAEQAEPAPEGLPAEGEGDADTVKAKLEELYNLFDASGAD